MEALGQEFAGRLLGVESGSSPVGELPVAVEDSIQVKGVVNPTYLVLIGFSTRKVLEAVKNNHSAFGKPKNVEHVLIIEPSMERFHALLKREYIGDLVVNDNYNFIVGVEIDSLLPPIQKTMSKNETKNVVAMAMRPEIVIDPFAYPFPPEGGPSPEAQAIIEKVNYASHQLTLSMGCASDSFNRWEQMIANEKNLQESYRIKPLFEQFGTIPAVVLGAGPSLADFIEAYKKYDLEDKCLIIASDAALKLLVENGIRPHIVTRCERKYTNIFRDVTPEHTRGVYFAGYPWVDHRYFEMFDEKFMLYRSNGVCRWSTYDPGFVDGGVSAANAALEIAFRLKNNPIILSGVDLCFIGDRSHIEGTQVEFDIERSREKWQKIKGNDKEVTSIPVWIRCLGEYQNAIFKHEARGKVINTSLQGAYIDGTVVKPWSEVGPMLATKSYVRDKIKKHLEKPNEEAKAKYEAAKDMARKELKRLHEDMRALFFDIGDSYKIARDEETKAILQLNHVPDSDRYWASVSGVQTSLVKVFELAASQIDQFKNKWYTDNFFNQSIADICQLDLFQNENKCISLKNATDWNHQRLKMYVECHLNFYQICNFYVESLLKLLK